LHSYGERLCELVFICLVFLPIGLCNGQPYVVIICIASPTLELRSRHQLLPTTRIQIVGFPQLYMVNSLPRIACRVSCGLAQTSKQNAKPVCYFALQPINPPLRRFSSFLVFYPTIAPFLLRSTRSVKNSNCCSQWLLQLSLTSQNLPTIS